MDLMPIDRIYISLLFKDKHKNIKQDNKDKK